MMRKSLLPFLLALALPASAAPVPATVTTTGDGDFTVNSNVFTPEDSSELTIAATDSSATLTSGTVSVSDSEKPLVLADATVKATSGKTVVTVTAGEDGTTTYSPEIETSAEFTVKPTDGEAVNYKMTAVGLTKGGTEIWTDATKLSDYNLATADDDDWSKMQTLTEDGALDLGNITEFGDNNVIVDKAGATARLGTFTHKAADSEAGTPESFTVDAADNAFTITLGDGDTALTANFNTIVNTTMATGDDAQGATYTVNGKNFKAENALTIAATYTASETDDEPTLGATLTTGKVTLDATNTEVTTTEPFATITNDDGTTTEVNTVTYSAGYGFTVEVDSEDKLTIGGLNGESTGENSDVFEINGVKYTAASSSLPYIIQRGDFSTNNNFQLELDADGDGYFKVVITDEFFLKSNWGGIIQPDENGVVDLTENTLDNGSSNVVTDDGKRLARITNEDGTYTVTENAGMDKIKLGGDVDKLATDAYPVTVTAEAPATGEEAVYTVNGEKFDAQT